MTIAEALERFLVQLEADGRSRHTIGQYRRHVRVLAHWMADVSNGGATIEALDHVAIARFLASPAARTRPDAAGKKASSVNALPQPELGRPPTVADVAPDPLPG